MSQYKRLIVILADGARYESMMQLIAAGRLPNLQKLFVSKLKGVTVFPSTTGPAYIPYITGCYPGTANVPGIRWFDKTEFGKKLFSLRRFRSYVGFESLLMDSDASSSLPNLCKILSESHNVFGSYTPKIKHNHTKWSKMAYSYYAHVTDRWDLFDDASLNLALKVVRQKFDFLFWIFMGIDELTHISEPNHPLVLQAYERIDRHIGTLCEQLKRDGLYEDTLIALVSDHGLSACPKHFGVAEFLEQQNYKSFYYPKIYKSNFKIATMVSGNGMNHLYFKDPVLAWQGRMLDSELQQNFGPLLQQLLAHPANALMISETRDQWIVVRSKLGEAKLKESADGIEYQVITQDPFGYENMPAKLSRKQALELSIHTKYPDSLVQIAQLFRSPRTGDVVLSAEVGYDLRLGFESPEHKSGHGALHADHMLIPLFLNAPLDATYARSVDIFPTVLKLLGREIPTNIDGQSLY